MSTTASPMKNKKHARKIPAIAPEESWWEVVAPVVLGVVDGSLGELPMPVYVLEPWKTTPVDWDALGLPVEARDGTVGVPWTFWGTPPLELACPLLLKGVLPGDAKECPVEADSEGELARAMGDRAGAGAGVVVAVLPLPVTVVLPPPPPPFPLPLPLPLPFPLPLPLPFPPPVPLPPLPPPLLLPPLPPPLPLPLPPPLVPPPLPPPPVPPPFVAVGDGDELVVGVGEAPPLPPPPKIGLTMGESIGIEGAGIGKLSREGSRSSSSLFIIARCRAETRCILYQS